MAAGAIDLWCNLFTPEAMQKYWFEVPELVHVMKWWHMEDRVKAATMPVEPFIEMMDRSGVDKVCIPASQIYSYQNRAPIKEIPNEEVAALVQKYPNRFIGLAGINPYHKMEGVRRLERAVKEYGFKGAHLHPYGYDLPIDNAAYYPFYAKCVELGIPVEIQVGHSAEAMPSAHSRPLLLDTIALYFPELKLIAAHTGWPWVEETIAMAWKHPNVYIATSAHAPKYWDKSLVRFANSRGKGKVLWATDYPVLTHEESLLQVDGLNLKEDAKRQLLREAALQVLNLA